MLKILSLMPGIAFGIAAALVDRAVSPVARIALWAMFIIGTLCAVNVSYLERQAQKAECEESHTGD
jgi:hypothetical protein